MAGPGLASLDRSPASCEELRSLVSQHALFAGVPPETLYPLICRCEVRTLAPGDVLLAPGQINRNLYLLLDGRLDVRIDRIDSEQGFVIAPGECTGEISVVDCRPATAFVLAAVPSRVLVLTEGDIWEGVFKIPAVARNFMRLFADRFRARNEAMQRGLEQQLRYEHLQKELAIAHDIQLGMLPRSLDLEPEVDVAAEMIPAQQVGGDFFDAFPISEAGYCVAIGDVSGKGVPAALFMVRTMTLLRGEMLKDQPLEQAVSRLNAMLCEENPTCMFATLIIGILNEQNGRFDYVNAGHDAVVYGPQGRDFRQLPPPRGILVGINASATYEVATVHLRRGDVLLMYTDGVTEAMNPERRLFSFGRLIDCLAEAPAESAGELGTRVQHAVRAFAAGAAPSDDLTYLILRYLGA
jgi:sigma-B regulation protein RsbU (phosphoserine phosphatase)